MGFEALIRWKKNDEEILAPSYFLDSIYKFNLSSLLFEHTLSKTINLHKTLLDNNRNFKFSINVNAKDLLGKSDIVEVLKQHSRAHCISERMLTLEITEGEPLFMSEKTIENLDRIQNLGVAISFDDMGTGYASAINFIEGNYNELKLDRKFVRLMHTNTKAVALIESLVYLSRRLNIPLIAEGVETRKDYDKLISLGCHRLQGYYLSPPLSKEQVELAFIRS